MLVRTFIMIIDGYVRLFLRVEVEMFLFHLCPKRKGLSRLTPKKYNHNNNRKIDNLILNKKMLNKR
jgi:hypothetical protein